MSSSCLSVGNDPTMAPKAAAAPRKGTVSASVTPGSDSQRDKKVKGARRGSKERTINPLLLTVPTMARRGQAPSVSTMAMNAESDGDESDDEIMFNSPTFSARFSLNMTVLEAAKNEEWGQMATLLLADVEGAKQADQDAMHYLPLHYALGAAGCSEAPLATVRLLLKAHPGVLMERGEIRELPLHFAVRNRQCTAEMVQLLLEACPVAAQEMDLDGALPVQLVLATAEDSLARDTTKRFVIDANVFGTDGTDECLNRPEKIRQRQDPWLVQTLSLLRAAHPAGPQLYMLEAAMYGEWARVDDLVQSDPISAQERTQSRALPLHLAVGKNAPERTVRRLFQAYPEAAKQKDIDGKTPLDWGCAYVMASKQNEPNNAAARTLQALLESTGQRARSDFEQADIVHVISTRFAGESNAAAADVKVLIESLREGVACFNPNTDNNKLAAENHAEANAIWLRRWREMLQRAHQTGGCLLQVLSVGEGLSHMQHAEEDMAADKHVPIVVLKFGDGTDGDSIEVQLRRHRLEIARTHTPTIEDEVHRLRAENRRLTQEITQLRRQSNNISS